MKIKLSQLRKIVSETVEAELRGKKTNLTESHTRITEEEFSAWKSGDWGFVSEDAPKGGSDRAPIPQDPKSLKDYIIKNFQGHMPDLGVDDTSDPVFKEYVGDQLAGTVHPNVLRSAIDML